MKKVPIWLPSIMEALKEIKWQRKGRKRPAELEKHRRLIAVSENYRRHIVNSAWYAFEQTRYVAGGTADTLKRGHLVPFPYPDSMVALKVPKKHEHLSYLQKYPTNFQKSLATGLKVGSVHAKDPRLECLSEFQHIPTESTPTTVFVLLDEVARELE